MGFHLPWRQPAGTGVGRPSKTVQRQHLELWLLYLGSLAGVLMLFALVLRGVFQQSQLAKIRSDLAVVGEDLASLPLPEPGTERDLLRTRRDFATVHQQLEWFREGRRVPLARLGEVRNLGPLIPPKGGKRLLWQEGPDWIALVLAVDNDGVGPPVWLRISEGLESTEAQLRRLDLSLSAAVLLALLVSALSARLITRRAVKPLEASLDRLRQFSLDASHELRGPLAALTANAEMGLLDTDPAMPAQRRRFEAIATATAQMESLVEDLLLLARQEEPRWQPLERVDLGAILEAQVAMHRDGMARRHQTLSVAVEPDLIVMGQPALLNRLFRNLLDNAVRYTPEHGSIGIRARRRGSMLSVAVEDTGIGLNEEQLSRVFDRFWRASPDRSDGGSGLGLAIASRICTVHGGAMRVTSQPGAGSCFVVDLSAVG